MPSPTVLIVDDDLDWLEIVSRFLEAHAFHVVTATNGTEALGVLESAPQLKAILLDLHMPIMSGLQFYRRVRRDRRFKKVPVYLVTADRRGDGRARRFIAGYLRKPLDLNALLAVLVHYRRPPMTAHRALRAAASVIAAAVICTLAGSLRAGPVYVLVDLGRSPAMAINQSGQIALQSVGNAPAIWENGVVRAYGVPPGFERASAWGLNDRGQLVGLASEAGPSGPSFGPPYHAFFWNTDGAATDLGVLPMAMWSRAEDLNNDGEVVGSSGSGSLGRGGVSRAVRWQSGRIVELSSPARTSAAAHAISDAGDIVGWAELYPDSGSPGPRRAVLWRNGVLRDLGSLGGISGTSEANDVNDSRVVVGHSSVPTPRPFPSVNSHAFIWRGGTMTDLGALPGAVDSRALAINRAGHVVGESGSPACGLGCPRAVLWIDGQIIDLNTLVPADSGWALYSAVDIDDRGRIIGWGRRNHADGQYFLLDIERLAPPAPEAPRSLAALVTGGSVTLTWQPPGSGAPGSYLLEAGSRAGASDLGTFVVGGTSTSLSASAPAGTYFVRLRSRDGPTLGAASNEVMFTVGGSGVPPGAPTSLQARVLGSNVTLSWVAPAGSVPVATYILEAGSAPGLADLVNASIGPVANYAAAAVRSGTYFVRVRAANPAGTSPPSSEITLVVP